MHKFFHKVLAAMLAVSMLTLPTTALAGNRPTTVLLEGEVLTTEAFIDENNRTQIPTEAARKVGVTREYTPGSTVGDTVAVEGYIPLRAAFTEAGYTVDWDSATGNVLLSIPAHGQGLLSEMKVPDYSKAACWYQLPEITKDVDTFYIYATEYADGSMEDGASDFASLDNIEMFMGVMNQHMRQVSLFENSTNVFIPLYRQGGMRVLKETAEKTGDIDAAISTIPYDDISVALDYYFENYNEGRPFILAGHSQGSAIAKYALKHYFKEHPEYYERMVAAYVVGYSVTKDDLEAYPHLKFATGETDTGVIVSWNTEGKKSVEENSHNIVVLPNEISINPLNWKLDDTYAPASENLGSYILNEETGEYEITDVGADAQLVPGRGVILTSPNYDETAPADFFGTQSFHEDDYALFYNNVKENVAKRIAAYQASIASSSPIDSPLVTKEKASMSENKQIVGNNYDKALAVKCVNGTFVGKKNENIIAYKGIPFVGQQPVGDLRWKAPVDVVPDDSVYEAFHYGKAPVQAPGDPAIQYGMGEDCLYLNIWKADEAAAEKKPVMVWIYGGGFEVGGTTDPQYDGFNLVKENPDVILVTIGYRVSFLGFMHLSHLPDGKDYQDAPNLGLMDQIMALKWVHENIESFGGDPDNVTIWGESAGGASVTLLPLIKGSHQYFKRVIAQSGSPTQTRTPEQAIACTDKLMEALGCKTVADLKKISAEKLADTWARLYGFYQVLGIRTFPERDGNYLPLNTWEAYANGAAKDIEFLQGCNKDEMNTFLGVIGVDSWNAWANERKAEKLAQLTDTEKALVESYCSDIEGESYEPTVRLFSQIMFIAPQIRLSEEQVKGGGKSYTYYFTPESALPLFKCGHMVEVPVVFNHPEMQEFSGRAFDETFAKTMRKMWVQFAKTGNPSLSADISPDGKAHEWPLYDLTNKQVMVLDEFDIHPEKESALKIVDWDRSYFLTNYYMP